MPRAPRPPSGPRACAPQPPGRRSPGWPRRLPAAARTTAWSALHPGAQLPGRHVRRLGRAWAT
eukprot:1318423-Heterocapsa_arctica.AAC.1